MITSIFLKYALDLHCFQNKYHKADITIFLGQHNILVSVVGPLAFQGLSTLKSSMQLAAHRNIHVLTSGFLAQR